MFDTNFIWLFCLLVVAFGGHISKWDVELNYNNAGYASEFYLSFSLDTTLSATDYLKIVMPLPLHTSFNALTHRPDALAAQYAIIVGEHHCNEPAYGPADIFINNFDGAIEENSYYI